MSNIFVQRQVSSTLCNNPDGTYLTTMAQLDPSRNEWALRDVRATTIMKLEPGKQCSGLLYIPATTGTATVPLPESYDTANRLAVTLITNTWIKCVTVSPAHSTSTVTFRGQTGDHQDGILSWVGRVTSITLSNVQATDATVRYFIWEYPADIEDNDAWRDGAQTTGVNTST